MDDDDKRRQGRLLHRRDYEEIKLEVEMSARKLVKRMMAIIVLAALVLAAAWVWWTFHGGVSHAEIRDTVREEADSVRNAVDSRCDAIERKLDRIESKLDRLIEMATPKLPDGMVPAE